MHTNDTTRDTTQPSNYQDGPAALQDPHEVSGLSHDVGTFNPKLVSHLSENDSEFPTALIAVVAKSSTPLPQRFELVRFDHLVAQCVGMTFPEEMILANLLLKRQRRPQRTPEGFYESLREAISSCRLWPLFARAECAEWHRSIIPAAYNERTGEVYPVEMAKWRADFRAMAPECQMMAATIIWLYRAGSDSIWLRRVPSSWRAVEALRYMRDADVLGLWLNLITNYPGW
jgi:hypothetical protein